MSRFVMLLFVVPSADLVPGSATSDLLMSSSLSHQPSALDAVFSLPRRLAYGAAGSPHLVTQSHLESALSSIAAKHIIDWHLPKFVFQNCSMSSIDYE